jgi:16S rRNA (guanine966-N2)-methyltransferase
MRVVAGSAKGRTLVAPEGSRTRPTSDRVREAIFNALYSLGDAAGDARVLDLYAGSGALGIEALSRGARHATFVDRDRGAIGAISQNVHVAGVDDRSDVVRADALDWLGRAPGEYDLVLCDPPYDFGRWPELLSSLETVVPLGVVVLESDRAVEPGAAWDVIRSRRYGGTVVTIIHRRAAA